MKNGVYRLLGNRCELRGPVRFDGGAYDVSVVCRTLARQIRTYDLSGVSRRGKTKVQRISYRMVESRSNPDSTEMVRERTSTEKFVLYPKQDVERVFDGGVREESVSRVCNV